MPTSIGPLFCFSRSESLRGIRFRSSIFVTRTLFKKPMDSKKIEHPQWYQDNSKKIDEALHLHKPQLSNQYDKTLIDSMNYSLFAGGKRIRPMLALSTFQALKGANSEHIFIATCALEMVHTFSLIHDDLPCMDDDNLRRGKPTNHIVYGEGVAVLSGTALCIHAFELICKTKNIECCLILCKALGIQGMLAGQTEDLLNEGKIPNSQTVDLIHQHKTGKLIEASIMLGAELANANLSQKQNLQKYGQNIGLAFQIIDDILDIEQSSKTLGKDAGSDQNRKKMTHPQIVGIENSKKRASELVTEAIEIIQKESIETEELSYLAQLIIKRVH